MSLVKYHRKPLTGFDFDFLFDDLFQKELHTGKRKNKNVPVNIKESEEAFQLELRVPGWKKNDIQLSINGNKLKIEGALEEKTKESTWKTVRQEFNLNSFERTFILPKNVDKEKIEAKYNQGILKVVLPKDASLKNEHSRQIKVD
ncbi:MAG: Hsp20/alpha crystallin family protein [Flavobacteriales bacterium]|nr:Hsp20/alpha crystallin family protein [Flavobacteriales bacterium]